ncbi:MAG: RHS repeat-associated core domain-containing protein [Candidatus Izemoplasmatales bacterium]
MIKKITIVLLCVFMVATSVIPQKSMPVYALDDTYTNITSPDKEVVNYPTTTDVDFNQSDVELEEEIISERTATSKTFLKEDGTYEVALYDDVVHYYENNQWNDIDNSLGLVEDEYETNSNIFKLKFPKKLDDNKKIKLDYYDYSIDWSIFNINDTSIAIDDNNSESTKINELININQGLVYSNVQSGVDLEYVITGSQIKENIILNQYISDYSLTFKYELNNLSLIEDSDGNIIFVNENLEEIFSLDDLYMIDNDGNDSFDVEITFVETKKDTYLITITPNDDWLSSASYPVSIDPSIVLQTNNTNIRDKYVWSTSGSSTTTNYIKSGVNNSYKYRSYIEFGIDSLPDNISINYAHLELNLYSKYTVTNDVQVNARMVNQTTSFDSISGQNLTDVDSRIIDYFFVDPTDTNTEDYMLDITRAISIWYEDGVDDGVLELRHEDESTQNYVYFDSLDYSTGAKPKLTIGYIYTAGIKDYWTYNSQQVGDYSTGYVSDYSGMLNIVRNDLSFQTERQSLSLVFGYNIQNKNTDLGYHKGWNIIYNTYVKKDSSGNIYTEDYTGNKVYYHATTCDSRCTDLNLQHDTYCYVAEDGSGDILVENKDHALVLGYYGFTQGNLYSYNYSGYLTTITDEYTDQSITITRNSSNQNLIESITDEVGNQISISYSNGVMSEANLYVYQNVSSSYLLEKTEYTYQAKNDGTGDYELIVEYNKNYDDSMSMAVDDILKYDYKSSGELYRHYIEYQDKVEYTFASTTDKVTNVKTYYDASIFNELTYSYSFAQTIITNEDNENIIYKFDSYGHTVNIVDSNGNAQHFKYLNLFSVLDYNDTGLDYLIIDGEPNYLNNNQLVESSSPQTNLFNPIENHGFEYQTLGFGYGWDYYNDIGDIYYEVDRTTHYDDISLFGDFSARLKGFSNENGHFEQTIELDEGVYTLSGYIKNEAYSDDVWISVQVEGNAEIISDVDPTGEWTKVNIQFTVGTGLTDQEVKISLVNHDIGVVYFDNIEIFPDFMDNRTNMMDNPSFESVASSGDVPGWYMSDSTSVYRTNIDSITNDDYENFLGNYAIAIDGSSTESRWACAGITEFTRTAAFQEVGQLIIGAWSNTYGTPTSISQDDIDNGVIKNYRIRIDFASGAYLIGSPNYESSIITREYIDFDPTIEGWQYQFSKINMPEDNTYVINVFFEYTGEGTVYFDGLQVFFEQSTTNYVYDEYGNLSLTQTSAGDFTEYVYDLSKDYRSFPKEINSSDGTSIDLSENDNEQINGIKFNNVNSEIEYNSYGQGTIIKVGFEDLDENGIDDDGIYYTTSTSYTSLNQYISTETNEFGNTTSYYNDTMTGLLEAIENAKGQDTHYIYDNEGKLIEVLSVDDYDNYVSGEEYGSITYMYNSDDQLWKIVLDSGYYYEMSYDAQGRIDYIYVNSQELTHYTYDDGTYYSDNISEQRFGNGDILGFSYNDNDLVTDISIKESGTSTFVMRFSYEYDQSGRIAVYNTWEDGSITESEFYTYNTAGQLIKVIDESNNIINYSYDDSGNLTSLYFNIDGEESTTSYQHNECFNYDVQNDVCLMTSSFYDKTSFTSKSFDDIEKDYHYETSALYRLDYIYLTGDNFNVKQNFNYTATNSTRISNITYEINGPGVNYKYSYSYDSLGNITKEYYYIGSSLELYRNYEYDEMNQLVVEDSRDYDESSTTLTDTNFTKYYYYDSRGNITDVKTFLYGQNDTIPVSIPSFYQNSTGYYDLKMYYNGYDDYNDIYELDLGETPSLIFKYYDLDNQTYVMGMTTTMTYSNLNVNQEGYYYRNYTATYGIFYEIDFRIVFKVGNPTGSDRTPQEHLHYNYDTTWDDQLEGYESWTYDGSGNHTGTTTIQEYTYDNQGNPINISDFVYDGTTYEYAVLSWSGRELTQIDVYNYMGINEFRLEYQYNDQGYRTKKAISYNTWDNGQDTFVVIKEVDYELDEDRVILEQGKEYNTSGNETLDYVIIYTYDYDGTLIGFNYEDDSNTKADYFYLRNQLGDITHILNADGLMVANYTYDAYGNIIDPFVRAGYGHIGDANAYNYRGYRYDSEINLYYLNSRYYNSEVARFINSDGLISADDEIVSANTYAYSNNNPILNVDYSGFAKATNYRGSKAWVQIGLMIFGVVGNIAFIKCMIWGLSLPGIRTLAIIVIVAYIALKVVNSVWTISNIGAAIYYTISKGGFSLKKHRTGFNVWYSVGRIR